jgi:hypothetical protein
MQATYDALKAAENQGKTGLGFDSAAAAPPPPPAGAVDDPAGAAPPSFMAALEKAKAIAARLAPGAPGAPAEAPAAPPRFDAGAAAGAGGGERGRGGDPRGAVENTARPDAMPALPAQNAMSAAQRVRE